MARIADLLMRQGDVAAQAALARGNAWAGAVQGLGNAAAGFVQQRQEDKAQKQRQAAVNDAMSQWDGSDPQALAMRLAPVMGAGESVKFVSGLTALRDGSQKQKPDEKDFANLIGGLKVAKDKLGESYIAQHWPEMQPEIQKHAAAFMGGVPVDAQWHPEYAAVIDEQFSRLNPAKLEKVTTRDAAGAETTTFVEPKAGAAFTSAAPPDKSPLREALDTKTNKPVFVSGAQLQAEPGRYQPMRTGVNVNIPGTGAKEDDAQSLAEGLVAGRVLPSTLSKRGDYNHILALADKVSKKELGRPLNFAKMQLDNDAAKRFVGSMNGNQMLRFRALAASVVGTMDEVKRLSEELKQGGVQKWNQAKRDTILQAYGNTPLSEKAARYVSAVNTLKEEFANLAQGGYAPTESAWKLANEQINGNFGLKDMTASIDEAQRLINYRIGAFNDLQPTLVGGSGGAPAHPTGGAIPAESQAAVDRLFPRK